MSKNFKPGDQVTTRDQWDALPVGTVIEDLDGDQATVVAPGQAAYNPRSFPEGWSWDMGHWTVVSVPETPAAPPDVAWADGDEVAGWSLIVAERRRQISVEGYTIEHDAEHGSFVLSQAALAYEIDGDVGGPTSPGDVPTRWPWTRESWKPRDPISNLIRAGALWLAAGDVPNARRCAERIDAIVAKVRAVVRGGQDA